MRNRRPTSSSPPCLILPYTKPQEIIFKKHRSPIQPHIFLMSGKLLHQYGGMPCPLLQRLEAGGYPSPGWCSISVSGGVHRAEHDFHFPRRHPCCYVGGQLARGAIESPPALLRLPGQVERAGPVPWLTSDTPLPKPRASLNVFQPPETTTTVIVNAATSV